LQDWSETRRQLLVYFGLAYGITWGAIALLLVALDLDFSKVGINEALLMLLFMLAGPSVAGIVLTAAFEGRAGLAGMFRRLTRLRVPLRWYALAALLVPSLLLAILLPLATWVSADYLPSLLVFGVAVGLLAGCLEELGWTGFATPRLLARYSPLRAGLILGLAWAAWHGLADFSGSVASMGVGGWLVSMVAYWIVPLTGYRVLMTWAYSHHRSLALAMLMHAGYTGWLVTLTMDMPAGLGSAALAWQLPFGAAIWLAVGVVVIRSRSARHHPVATAQPA
jgi:uncharacterized protein